MISTQRPPLIARVSCIEAVTQRVTSDFCCRQKFRPTLISAVTEHCISDVSPWPWPWSLRPKSKSLALALALWPKSLALIGLGLEGGPWPWP